MMRTAAVRSRRTSASWEQAAPDVSVVIATHDRAQMLPELSAALAAQQGVRFEVVVADDGSRDETSSVLEAWSSAATYPMCALVLEPSGGPSLPRNTGASIARAPLLAFLDDDCLPEPGWLAALLSAAAGREAVIQGRTVPDGDRPPTAWARAIRVEGPSVLYESCNIAYRRTVFVELGGFPLLDLLPGLPAARGFGEDVLLGCRAAASYGASFAGTAVVRHRWLPGDYRDHLAARRRLVGFAELARRCPEVRAALTSGVFLSRHTARFDLAVAAALAAAAGPWWLAAGAVPYLRAALAEARWRGGPLPLRVTQLAIADAVGLASLLRGSASARMPVF